MPSKIDPDKTLEHSNAEPDSDCCFHCDKPFSGESKISVDYVICCRCEQSAHPHCIGIPSTKNPKKAQESASCLLNLPGISYTCPACLGNNPKPAPAKVSITKLEKKVETLADNLNSVMSLFQPAKASQPPSKSKGQPGSYAAAVSKNLSSTGLIKVLSSAIRHSASEEERLRSIVVDGLSLEEGCSDEENIREVLAYAGLAPSEVRIQSIYRMGKLDMNGRPPKLKLVLGNVHMQHAILSKDVRAKLHKDDCPYPGLYFNPSRSWEDRRLLMKLCKQQGLLNEKIANLAAHWFLHYPSFKLVKKEANIPAWDGAGDVGWADWSEQYEKAFPLRQPTAELKLGPGDSRPRRGNGPCPSTSQLPSQGKL